MNNDTQPSEFLVISRGKWDENLPPERIQTAIDDFYVWLERMVAAIEGDDGAASVASNGGHCVAQSS